MAAMATEPALRVMRDPPAEAEPRRRLARRIVELTLPEPYDDCTCSLWINLPAATANDLYNPATERLAAAFAQLVVRHDLVDDAGAPFPPGGSPDLFAAIPTDLFVVIRAAWQGQIGKLTPPSAGR